MDVVGCLLLIIGYLSVCYCFNVDIRTAVLRNGPSNSMFGFSVAQHIDQGRSWLLVGAPRASSVHQPSIDRSGAVYRCSIDESEDTNCQSQMEFDTRGNDVLATQQFYRPIEEKSDQWFGATVVSSGRMIVACAPRYVYFSQQLNKREPVGSCWVKTSAKGAREYSPCKSANWGYHQQGYCQAGYSTALFTDGSKLLIGAVGSWYWQGQLFTTTIHSSRNVRPQYLGTPEGPPETDNSYMGYSSAVGNFDDDNIEDFVVGAPKAENLTGKVLLYTSNLTSILNITGEQIGAYFGYCLVVTDLNGDKLDDIIIGAPFHNDFSKSGSYETGRVYVYYQTVKRKFRTKKKDLLGGDISRSRFGLTMTGLGDINLDGYKDLAVGAPYAGEDHKGAIYIYHGSSEGVLTVAAQVIKAMDVSSSLSTFGYSLSGGLDMDGNSYPDILVGAYGSDSAVFFRTRPVVRVTASLEFADKLINLNDKWCSLIDGTQVTCLKIDTCLKYEGIGVQSELHFDVSWDLDIFKNRSARAFFVMDEQSTHSENTLKLSKDVNWCTTSYAYVKNKVRDKLTPIVVKFEFGIHVPKRRRRSFLEPILDKYIPTYVQTEAEIQKNCGRDNICVPDLVLRSRRLTPAHIIGNDTNLEILITVENRKEDAFETTLYVKIPSSVSYASIEAHQAFIPIGFRPQDIDSNTVILDLGNPLPMGQMVNFTMRFSPKDAGMNGTLKTLKFKLEVNSSNDESFRDTRDNVATVHIPVTAVAKFEIFGVSRPEQIIFNASNVKDTKPTTKGPTVTHLFEVRNSGPSNATSSELIIYWMSYDSSGNPMLQMLEPPVIIKGVGYCVVSALTPANGSVLNFERTEKGRNVVLLKAKKHSRSKREENAVKMTCSKNWCTIIRCNLNFLAAGDNMLIEVNSRLSMETLIKKDYRDAMDLTSIASIRVTGMPYEVDISKTRTRTNEISTYVNAYNLFPERKGVQVWIIGVAVTAGLLLLFLIIVLLWWCGFFKRLKPEDSEPLQNGQTKHGIEDKTFD